MSKSNKFTRGFERIKEALSKKESSGSYENFMRFPAGKTYTIKLFPTIDESKPALFHHYINSWTSKKDESFQSCLSLKTFGESDPVSNLRWKLWKEWKKENPNADNKDYNNDITESEQWLINAYWVDNPDNPELNGTVQILKVGIQLKKIIDTATEGDRSDELGYAVFDPTAGYDFKIIAEKKGIYTSYPTSYFTSKSKVNLTEEEVDKLYEGCFDLEQVYPIKTKEEIEAMLDEHWYVTAKVEPTPERKSLSDVKSTKENKPQKSVDKSTDISDSDIDSIFDGLEDDLHLNN